MKVILTGALLAVWMSFAAAAEQTISERLSSFYPGDSTLRLQGQQAAATLSIPLAAGQSVTTSSIKIKAVSSRALIKPRSILNVRFNNATIGQINMDPERPNISADVAIPTELWRSGFNALTFAVSQHYGNQCVDASAPELWSEINLYASSLSITTENTVEQPLLRDLSGFFSPGIGGQESVTLVTAAGDTQASYTQSVPLVAQALALRNQYKPLKVSYQRVDATSPAPELPGDKQWDEALSQNYYQSSWYLGNRGAGERLHVLIGTKAALKPFLGNEIQQKITGAFVGIEKTPALKVGSQTLVAASTRLVVSGQNAQQVQQAALTLGLMDDTLNPDEDTTILRQTTDISPLPTNILQPGFTYTFARLGQADITMRGENSFSEHIKLLLPADFYVPENAGLDLTLDFGYGAAFGPGSMMNILVNDELVHGLTLDTPNGEFFQDYQVTVPARHLHGGMNDIAFVVTQRAPVTGQACDNISGSHLIFQISNSSSVTLPAAGQVATQPSLKLFKDTAYPFARYNDPNQVGVYLTDQAMTGAALTLIAKLAQTAGTPLPDIELFAEFPKTLTSNAIVLATPDTLPDSFSSTYNASVAATKRWPYRLQNELHNRIREVTKDTDHSPLRIQGMTEQQSGLNDMAVLVAQKNPAADDPGSVYIIAAETPAVLTQRVDDLVSLSLWGQLAGDFFSWRSADRPLLAMQVAEQFEVGEPGSGWLALRMWMSNNPWYWLIGVALIIIFSTLIAAVLLRRRNQTITEQW